MKKIILTNEDCIKAANRLWCHFVSAVAPGAPERLNPPVKVFGVPRGGVPTAYLVCRAAGPGCIVTDALAEADLVVDDIIASGATRQRYHATSRAPFLALASFLPSYRDGSWLVFPWEQTEDAKDTSADDIILRLLQYIGENPARGGLLETPKRVLKAWKEWTAGYDQDPAAVLKCFADGGENYDQMVLVKDIPFYSHCEHHLAPFFGTATIAYLPDKRVVGLSKLSRILQIFAKRLQVQERLTTQIADSLFTHLQPKGVGVLLKARHLCMESRGVQQQGHHTVTSALRGEFMKDPTVRSEFLSLAQS